MLYIKRRLDVGKDPTVGIMPLSEKQHVRNRFLSAHEIGKIIEAAKQTRAKFYLPAIIYLGVEHGAARQEILSLKWSNIDFDCKGKGMITLNRTKAKKQRTDYIMPRTKQASLDCWLSFSVGMWCYKIATKSYLITFLFLS
jgi:integrase